VGPAFLPVISEKTERNVCPTVISEKTDRNICPTKVKRFTEGGREDESRIRK
jgi:hypothetical protein